MIDWQRKVMISAGREDVAAKPTWDNRVPVCSDTCPYHDGKRCELIGSRPSHVCEPVTAEMGELLEAS